MATRSTDSLPVRVEKARDRFEAWRKTRKQGERIPKRLWNLAVRVAEKHGPYKTSRALRLDYMGLKRRMADSAVPAVAKSEAARFVEVTDADLHNEPDCVVLVESRSGAKLRIELRGVDPAQIGLFARSFAGEGQ